MYAKANLHHPQSPSLPGQFSSGNFGHRNATISDSHFFLGETGDDNIDGLFVGTFWYDEDNPFQTEVTYSFPQDSNDFQSDMSSKDVTAKNNLIPFGSAQQSIMRQVLNGFEDVANLEFTKVAPHVEANIVIAGTSSSNVKTASSEIPYLDNVNQWYNAFYNDLTPKAGSYTWKTLIHETGHSLGLAHGHEIDRESPFYDPIPGKKMKYSRDSMEFSVMTYRSYIGKSLEKGYSNDESSYAQSLMMYDIAALQEMYGANYDTNNGDTTYKFSSNTGELLINGVGQGKPDGNRIFRTIWDGDGKDTYDFSNYDNGMTVDLRPGNWSLFSGTQQADLGDGRYARANVFNALTHNNDTRSLIENAIGGDGNDIITGNSANNNLKGSDGNDTLDGNDGNDTLLGGDGNDILRGGDGADVLRGGDGNDTIYFDNSDKFWDSNRKAINIGGKGTDTLIINDGSAFRTSNISMYGFEKFEGANQSDSIRGASNSVNYRLDGGGGDDILRGAGGDDTLIGGDGNDTLRGGDGADTLRGRDGNDIIYFDKSDKFWDNKKNAINIGGGGRDTLILEDGASFKTSNLSMYGFEKFLGSNRTDSVRGASNNVDYHLDGGAGNDTLRAEGGDDTLIGGIGNDTLIGGDGNDVLQGGHGADILQGGDGHDTIYFDNLDKFWDSKKKAIDIGGDGRDTLILEEGSSFRTSNLSMYGFERFQGADLADSVRGASNDINYRLVGGGGDDNLRAEGGDDTLIGGEGNDTLRGGAGADILRGREGNDTIYFDNLDKFWDSKKKAIDIGGDGRDTLILEEGSSFRTSNLSMYGFERFQGADLADSVRGASNDINYRLVGGGGDDNLRAEGGDDTLIGGEGNDTLRGGAGADILQGGVGDDIYYVSNTSDTVTEELNAGLDTVFSSVSFELSDNVEHLTLIGDGSINSIGNALDNVLTGNDSDNQINGAAGDDILSGEGGIDILIGGEGNDTYYIHHQGDIVTEELDAGSDIVFSSVSFELSGNIESLTLIGNVSINATGNALNNTIIGNNNDNIIDGASGTDTMSGGIGDDTYYVDDLNDLVVEEVDEGTDIIFAVTSYGLAENVENLTLTGTTNSYAVGNSLNNTIVGNDGDNFIEGGAGTDVLTGGAGSDSFNFREGMGNDIITDFEVGIDKINIPNGPPPDYPDFIISDIGEDTLIKYNDDSFLLKDVDATRIDPAAFDWHWDLPF
ncbi:Bifunctional hemolysin/adenylate cyclase precursor [Pseudovibrio sp. Ad46]|uniref:M10 family metallopeptidase C-terminal domain-containing protein n=1 Tax=Pseudovibrio sp. Ad46 TaxID=989432 RepID=UPI0007AEC70E|nr:hypothetical protein [Pseudovibrio sp. Ad46]KZK77081.1 Bifunctional hemolysin/adenylate cyclase precursor [Pseudovibrio sp. Ad46]